MMGNLRAVLLLATVLWTTPGLSQKIVTEVIPLVYRSAVEIIPIMPLLKPPPGVVKTEPELLKAIKQVLSEFGRALHNLMVTVRHGISDNLHRSSIESDIVLNTKGSDANVRVYDTWSTTEEQNMQRIRVPDGRQALIQFGEFVPLAQRSLIVFGNTVTV